MCRNFAATLAALIIAVVTSHAWATDRKIEGFGAFKFGMSESNIIDLLGPG
jgi:hypothetical protein